MNYEFHRFVLRHGLHLTSLSLGLSLPFVLLILEQHVDQRKRRLRFFLPLPPPSRDELLKDDSRLFIDNRLLLSDVA